MNSTVSRIDRKRRVETRRAEITLTRPVEYSGHGRPRVREVWAPAALLLLGAIIWLFIPAKQESLWKKVGPLPKAPKRRSEA